MAFFGATTNCKGTDSGLQEDSDPAVDSCWYKFRDGTCSLASIPSYSTGTRPYPVYAPVGSQANSGCTWTSGYASPDVSSFGSDSEKQPGSESFTATVASQHEGGLRKQSSTSVVDVRFNWTLQLTSGDQSQGSPLSQCTIHYSPEVIIRQQLPKDMEPSTMPPPGAKDVSSHNAPEGSIAPEDHSHVMSPIHQEILQVFMPQLTQYMSPTALLPYLQRLDLLSPEDADFITNPLRTDLERRHRVLKRAPYRDPGAFERFVQCLSEEPEHPGHKYLARRLREAMLKKQQNPNAILRQTSSSESPQATSPELQRTPSRTCTRSHSTRSCYSDGSRRSRDESTSTATAKAALPQRRKSHDSQLRDRGGVIPSIPPRPSRGAPQDSSRTLHQQIKDQVRAVVHNPTSPPYGMLPPTGPTTAAIPRSLPASPVLSRRPSHTFDYEDNFRSLRRVPRPAQGRKMSSADEKLNKKKLEWLQERVQFQENSEVVVFDSHTHCGHERRLLYSGVLQEHGKPRFVVLLNDMLLILKSRRRRASHLDWFSDQEFTARKPLLLHLLTLQKQTKKQHMCMYFKNQSELMEICLQACSEDAKKVWVEQLSEAITLSTAAHAGTVLSIGNKISKKHSGKPYTKVTLTELTVMELLLPKHCLRGQLYCVVGVGRQRCRTTGVSGGGILEWNIRCEFSDITRKDFLMIQLCRESTFRPDDLLGSVTIPLPTLTLEQPGPHVMEGQLPLLNREQAIIGTIALHAEIGWETKM